MTDNRITVVIATLNEEAFIAHLLDSLDRQTLGREQIEIVIVDGRSEDDTLAIAGAWAQSNGWEVRTSASGFAPRTITIVDNPQRRTPNAFNIGISLADSRWVVIVGAHSVLDQGFLECGIQTLNTGGADVVGGVMKVAASAPHLEGFALAQMSVLATGGAGYRHAPSAPCESDTVPFPAFAKSLWEKIGGFDEALLRNQDDDFILRARSDGAKVILNPQIKFTYFVRASISKLWKQYFQYGEYRIQTIYKRRRLHSLRPLAPFALVSVFAAQPVILLTRFSPIVPVVAVGYVSILGVEAYRLAGVTPPGRWLKCFGAIATMQLGYGIGETFGIGRLISGKLSARQQPRSSR